MAALLWGAALVPVAGWAHWEGFAAADPSTPAALLRFESAAAGYTDSPVVPESWPARFEVDGQPGVPDRPSADERGTVDHSEHASAAQPTPASIPR